MGYRKNPVNLDELRRMARARLLGKTPGNATVLSLEEAQKIFEELEIHQIELELQNEHLSAARAQLETALNQSSELYDFAPVGIISIDRLGAISKLNLAGANLLGGERARLLGSRLGLFVVEAERQAFNALLEQASVVGDVRGKELALIKKGLPATPVQIWISQLPEAQGWQLILVDMTERRQAQEKLRASDERWRLALDASGDGVWDWRVQSGEMLFSKRFEELYGFSENEYGRHIDDLMHRVHPEDAPQLMAVMQSYLSGTSEDCLHEFRAQCKDGSWKWVLCRGAVVTRSEEGKPLRMIGTHVDIMSRKKTEDALLDAVRFQQAVFDSLSAQIAVLDRHGTVVQTNAAWRDYAFDNGFADSSSFVGCNYLELLGRMTEKNQETLLAAANGIASVAGGEVHSFQLKSPFYSPLDKRWFSMKVTPVHDVEERVVVSHEDVSMLKAAELASLTLANTDALTGALSRRNFMDLAEQELARSIRYATPLMVLMLDLDHFKLINDRYGHAAGDAVLKGFVQTVTSVLRESDLIGRIGGEEFAVLLPNTNIEGGRALAQRIIDSVRSSPVDVDNECLPYTVSIGAGCLSKEPSFAALLSKADLALYQAKSLGRDRLEVCSLTA